MNLYTDIIANNALIYATYHLVFYVVFWMVVYHIFEIVGKRKPTVAYITTTRPFQGLYAALAVADVLTAVHLKGFAGWWILPFAGFLYVVAAWQIFVITLLVKDAKKTGEIATNN